ncbi:hypothetical protein AAG906_002452 [Vitis piasezkii]
MEFSLDCEMAFQFQPIFLLPLFFSQCFTQPIFSGDHTPFKGPLIDPFIALFGEGNSEKGSKKYSDGSKENGGKGEYKGGWELVSHNSGVMAMHMVLLPRTNKVVMVEAANFGPSQVRLSRWKCRLFLRKRGINDEDCWAHAVEYNTKTAAIRPLKMVTNAWGSSGGLSANGTLVQAGGWSSGARTVRYLSGSKTSRWIEYSRALSRKRWYSTQHILPDGRFVVIGGRRMFNYEFIPRRKKSTFKVFKLAFLERTTDDVENNLYPFVFLSTDGNLFIFANNRSILFNPITHKIIRRFPILSGGSRNYPASGMSALLPIQLHDPNPKVIRAEVIVCGGARPEAAKLAEKGVYLTALQGCGRMEITAANATWTKEVMPTPRVMGDMLVLPTGDLLMLNGAKRGTSGWNFADDPNYVPVLYKPDGPITQRFTELKATSIARMYHSTSALLPDGTILVAGSNTKNYYFTRGTKYPTEFRVEKFYPPYLDPLRVSDRPKIETNFKRKMVKYGKGLTLVFKLKTILRVKLSDLKVTMQLINTGGGRFRVSVVAPPSAKVAPPGYYLIFVVHQGLPSPGGEWGWLGRGGARRFKSWERVVLMNSGLWDLRMSPPSSSHHLGCCFHVQLYLKQSIILTMSVGSCGGFKCPSRRLENIEEDGPASWLPETCAPPETPIESMEFLARSWSLSAMELAKALAADNLDKYSAFCSVGNEAEIHVASSVASEEAIIQQLPDGGSPPISPRDSDDMKELFLLHQALNPDFLSNQQLLRNGLYKSIMRGKTFGRRLKDQKERKKQEIRTHNAQLHAAVSVAGVAAAVAALAASNAASPEVLATQHKKPSKHLLQLHLQQPLRGAATLRARLQKGCGTATLVLSEEQIEEGRESNILIALNFVSRGGELLKRTRKGALHWKQVSFNINSCWQVAVKMKSKHMAGTFTKKKKCVVSGVYCDIPAWLGREREESSEQRAYFGIKTDDRIIEFECRNNSDKQMWAEGIQYMLHCRASMI